MANALDVWEDTAEAGKTWEALRVHFRKEHRKLRKNTGATTAALDRTSFLANNTLMEALQQAEEQAEAQMTTHMANAVSS